MTRTTVLVAVAAAALLVGCARTGSGSSASAGAASAGDASAVVIEVADTDVGESLVGPDGMTLYIFTEDPSGSSACVDECAANWPPLVVEEGTELQAGDGVTGELGTITRDDGATQASYDGMPLYHFAGDGAPGDASGEGVGGVWFIASPSGEHDMSSEPPASDEGQDDY